MFLISPKGRVYDNFLWLKRIFENIGFHKKTPFRKLDIIVKNYPVFSPERILWENHLIPFMKKKNIGEVFKKNFRVWFKEK